MIFGAGTGAIIVERVLEIPWKVIRRLKNTKIAGFTYLIRHS
jgi:hypothetical protein